MSQGVGRMFCLPKTAWPPTFEAFICLLTAKALVTFVKFSIYNRIMGELMVEAPAIDYKKEQRKVFRTIRAIDFLSDKMPWKNTCLVRAIAVKLMLRRRKVKTTVYLGVGELEGKFEAHAWVKVGDRVICGETNKDSFKVVSYFGDM